MPCACSQNDPLVYCSNNGDVVYWLTNLNTFPMYYDPKFAAKCWLEFFGANVPETVLREMGKQLCAKEYNAGVDDTGEQFYNLLVNIWKDRE